MVYSRLNLLEPFVVSNGKKQIVEFLRDTDGLADWLNNDLVVAVKRYFGDSARISVGLYWGSQNPSDRELHIRVGANGSRSQLKALRSLEREWLYSKPVVFQQSCSIDVARPYYRAEDAVDAIKDLGEWLGLSQSETIGLCCISTRSFRSWTHGTTMVPRHKTVDRLYTIHNIVGTIRSDMGAEESIGWLNSPSREHKRRLDMLSTEHGIQLLIREASDRLFVSSPKTDSIRPELLMVADEEEFAHPADSGAGKAASA